MHVRQVLCLVLPVLLSASAAHATIRLRVPNPARHDRFYAGPDKAYIGDPHDWSGVARHAPNTSDRWATMISPSYFLSANHWHPGINPTSNPLRFHHDNDAAGPYEDRYVVAGARIGTTDLWIGKLNAPVSSSVAIYPVLSVADTNDCIGLELLIFGQSTYGWDHMDLNMRTGRNLVTGVSATMIGWVYDNPGVGDDEAECVTGDSGGPSFVITPAGPALVGIHYTPTGDSYAPGWVEEINAYMRSTQGTGALEQVTLTTLIPLPTAPANLVAAVLATNQVMLAWTDRSNNEDGFKIERSVTGTNFTAIATVSANVSTYMCPGLAPNTLYSFRVRAYNGGGDSDYSNTAQARTPAQAPVASFTASPTNGVAPLTVRFANTSTGNITNLLWQFGDGRTSSVANPTHVYTTSGTYGVTLTVAGLGGSDSITRPGYIVVAEPPPDTTPPVLVVAQPSDFQVFADAGITVSGTASDPSGIQSVTVDGAGATVVGANWSCAVSLAVGTNRLTVIARDASPQANAATQTVQAVLAPPVPVADFAASPTAGRVPLMVQFTDASTGWITGRHWTFGDGDTSSAVSPSHAYDQAGTYTVGLTVWGPGGTGTATRAALVAVTTNRGPALVTGPIVHGATFQDGLLFVALADAPLLFKAVVSDPDADAVQCQWWFGDGSGAVGTSVAHAYSACQSYAAELVYSDGSLSHAVPFTVSVPWAMEISNLELRSNFRRSQRDAAKLRGSLELGPAFEPAGQRVTAVVGGAAVSFLLDAKGRGETGQGRIAFRHKGESATWLVKARLRKGDWHGTWAAHGLVNGTTDDIGLPVRVPVILMLDPESYLAEPALMYKATQDQSGHAQ